ANGTRTTYDKVGRVVSTERLANVVINIQETSSGSDVWEIVPQSGGVDYTFTSVISTSATTYDAAGRADIVTGTDGKQTDYEYDLLGRVTSLENALGQTTTYAYDDAGRQTSVTDAKQHTTTQIYDELGRVVRTVFHDGTSVSVAYDDLGRKVSETDALGNTTRYEYDSRGNLTAVVQPYVPIGIGLISGGVAAQPRWEYEYDRYGNLVLQRDPQDNKFTGSGGQNRETTFEYDEQNRRVERKLPLGQTELSFYDAFGRLERMTDFEGQNHTFEFDALGRVDEEKWFGVGVNPATGTAGQTVTYRFDALGRQDRVTEVGESNRITNYAFDVEGRLTSVDSPEGRVNYDYDAATGRHVRRWTGTNPSSPTTDTLYGYDELGRLKSVTSAKLASATPAAPAVQLSRYDASGNAVATTLPTTTYAYDAAGNRQTVSLPSGIVTSYAYDDLNRLDVMENKLGATMLSSYDYTVRADDTRSRVVETRLESGGNTTTRTIDYEYDAVGRLTRESSSSNGDYAENYNWVYGYDRAGNRTIKWNGAIEYWREYAYDANDRLTQEVYGGIDYSETIDYSYDANGSLIGRDRYFYTAGDYDLEREQTNEERTYGYDLRNRLVSFDATELREIDPEFDGWTLIETDTTAAYAYDHAGIRVGSDVTTTVTDHTTDPATVATTTDNKLFLVDGANPTGYAQVLEEKGTPSSSPSVTYVIGDDVIGQANSSGTLAYLVYDGHGSTRLLTTAAGAISERYSYDAFGVALAQNPATPGTDLLYAGEQFDAGLGQYYLRARYYDQSAGRFSSFDAYEGTASDPGTLHKYQYGNANPVYFIDPSGHTFAQVAVGVGAVLAITGLFVLPMLLSGANISLGPPPQTLDPQLPPSLAETTVLMHTVTIRGSRLSLDEVFDLTTSLSELPADEIIRNRAPTQVGDIVRFTLTPVQTRLGQRPFNVRIVRFDRMNRIMVAETLEGHPLVGWRGWEVGDYGGGVIIVKTWSVDAPANRVEGAKFGLPFIGGEASQSQTWTRMLDNIVERSGGNVVGGFRNGIRIDDSRQYFDDYGIGTYP
ncbi:MAG: RHS repeat-associated core domain-containing protein, partial [Tepidisphaeraceae bacterium]